MAKTQKISTYLWFDRNAEEAVNFYTSIFDDSRIVTVARYGEPGPGPAGSVMNIVFELAGQQFMALNGGPHFKFTPAISLFVSCETQEEVDTLWGKLVAGGAPSQCGWLTDKFGLSWQIIPKTLMDLIADPEPHTSARVMKAMMGMEKIDIAGLKRARDQK